MTGARCAASTALIALMLLAATAASAPPPVDHPPSAATVDALPSGTAVASTELVTRAAAWDRRFVVFSGEAVGEPMVRGSHAWLHINDDAYQTRDLLGSGLRLQGYNSGQAVWAPASLVRLVSRFGGYRRQGDAVRVLGTFNAACREHGGDMDIHATSLEIVREGHIVTRPPHPRRFRLGLGLVALAGVLAMARRRLGQRLS
jgi:hypothetical protein